MAIVNRNQEQIAALPNEQLVNEHYRASVYWPNSPTDRTDLRVFDVDLLHAELLERMNRDGGPSGAPDVRAGDVEPTVRCPD